MTSSSSSSPPPTASSPGEPGPGEPGAIGPEPDASGPPYDSIIDLSGELCPFTFVRTKLALELLPMGGTLRVLVDHEPASRNIPRSAREWGQEIRGVRALPAEGTSPPMWAIDLRRLVR